MATEHQTGTEVPGAGEAAFPPFDPGTFSSTIFWLIITFGLLYLLMARVALPRVQSILKTRSDKIHEGLAAARKMRKEAEEAAAAYEKTLAEARANSQALANEAREKAKVEQDAKRQVLEAELDEKLKAAEARIAETKAQAMTNVSQIATEAAGAIVEHLTGQTADQAAIAQAVAAHRV